MLNSFVALSSLATLKPTIILMPERPLLAESGRSFHQFRSDLNDRFGEKRTIKREAQFRLRASVLVTLAVTGTLGVTAMGLMTWAPFHWSLGLAQCSRRYEFSQRSPFLFLATPPSQTE
jgi:hypothetical protein